MRRVQDVTKNIIFCTDYSNLVKYEILSYAFDTLKIIFRSSFSQYIFDNLLVFWNSDWLHFDPNIKKLFLRLCHYTGEPANCLQPHTKPLNITKHRNFTQKITDQYRVILDGK